MQEPSATLPLAERSATPHEKRVGGALAALWVVLTLAVVPWASLPGEADPRIPLVADVAICIVDLCIALLLATSYRANGRHSLMVLTGVYVYGGLMAALHLATFPGTLGEQPLFGGEQTLVALTGMGQKTDQERTRDAGFDEHLTKPADPERLARVAAGTDRDENVVAQRTKL